MQRPDVLETSLDWSDCAPRLRPVPVKGPVRSQAYEATNIQRALHEPAYLLSESAQHPVSRAIDEHSSANGQELPKVGVRVEQQYRCRTHACMHACVQVCAVSSEEFAVKLRCVTEGLASTESLARRKVTDGPAALTKIPQTSSWAKLGHGKGVELLEADPASLASSAAEPPNATESMLQRLEAAERAITVRDTRLEAAENSIELGNARLEAAVRALAVRDARLEAAERAIADLSATLSTKEEDVASC